MLDLLIKNAAIIDGTGTERYTGNVGVKDGKITFDCSEEAKETIDASGLCLSPGFIDVHSHGDGTLGTDFGALCKICHGVTTEITGQCGTSMFPVDPDNLESMKTLFATTPAIFPEDFKNWTSFGPWAAHVDSKGLILNATCYVGHAALRHSVMGLEDRKPTPEELEKMKATLRTCMEQGAFGMSSGLIYPPSCYADTEELIELAKVVAEYGGIYATHMRSESRRLVEALDEALEIARTAGCRLCISHLKVAGKQFGEKGEIVRAKINAAIAEGMDIVCDQYPYDAAMTNFSVCVPPKYFQHGIEGVIASLKDPETRAKIRDEIADPNCQFENNYQLCGGWDGIWAASLPKTPQYNGMSIPSIAEAMQKDPFDAYFDLIIENEGVGGGIYFTMREEDLAKFLVEPYTVVGSDGICQSRDAMTHPRSWGTCVRAICYYVKEKKLLSLEQMIRKLTSLSAEKIHLPNKGKIAEGYDADLVLFDYENLVDRATYKTPTELADGIEYVFVNGVLVYHDKQLTGARPGKLLRYQK